MKDERKTKKQLIDELNHLRQQVDWLQADYETAQQNSQDAEMLRGYVEQVHAVFYLVDLTERAKTTENVYRIALDAAQLILQADGASLSLDRGEWVYSKKRAHGLSVEFYTAMEDFLPTLSHQQDIQPLFISNIEQSHLLEPVSQLIQQQAIQAMSYIPLINQGKLIGQMTCYYRTPRQFSEVDVWLTQMVSKHIVFAIEQKRADEALRKSERSYRTLASNLPNAMTFLFDAELRCLVAEGLAFGSQTLFKSSLEGKTIWDMLPHETCTVIEPYCQAALGGIRQSLEFNYQQRAYYAHFLPIEEAINSITAGLFIAEDITERKEAEIKLANLLTAEKKQRILAQTLGNVFLSLTAQTTLDAVLEELLNQLQQIVSYSAASIMLLEEKDTLRVVHFHGYDRYNHQHAMAGLIHPLSDFPLDIQMIHTRQAIIVADTAQEPDWVAVEGLGWVRSCIIVPICFRTTVLGLLRLDSHETDTFSVDDSQRLQPLANAAAIALENAMRYAQAQQEIAERKQAEQETRKLNRKLLALQYAGATIASSLDIKHILSMLTKEMVELLSVTGCVISEWNESDSTITVITEYNRVDWWKENSSSRGEIVYHLTEFPPAEQVLSKLQPVQMNMSQPDIHPAAVAYMQIMQVRSLLFLPMEYRTGVLGFVELFEAHTERLFTPDEVSLAQQLANQAAGPIQNARLYSLAQKEILERQQVEQRLRRAIGRNQAMLNAIPDSMLYLNREAKLIEYYSARDATAAHQTRREPSESRRGNLSKRTPTRFVGASPAHSAPPADLERPSQLLDIFPKEVVDKIQIYLDKTLSTQAMQVFEYQQLFGTILHDFEARSVASNTDEVLLIVRDITERKQAEQQLVQGERLAALGRLTAALAHEINNPLQIIQSNLDLILKYSLPPSEQQQSLQIISEQIERTTNLTKDMLDMAHPKAVSRQPTNVTTIVKQVLNLAGKELEQSRVKIHLDTHDVPDVLAVPDQLSQVFLNLLLNAIEVMPNGGHLQITVYSDNDDVVISFINDGPAIPASILSNIFEPFFTTKPEGSGLGLWISHNLIQQHNGSLTIKNLTHDCWVVFTVTLPANSSVADTMNN